MYSVLCARRQAAVGAALASLMGAHLSTNSPLSCHFLVKLRAFPHILCVLHQLSTDATVLVGALCRSSADGCCTVELPVGQVGSSRSTATQCASNNNNSSLRKALFLANC